MPLNSVGSVEKARKCIVEAFVRSMSICGYSTATGVLCGTLFSEGPLSFDKLVEKAGYSKSTVCTNANLLQKDGIVVKLRKLGSSGRRNHYVHFAGFDEIVKFQLENIRQINSIFTNSLCQAESYLSDNGSNKEADQLRDLIEYMRKDCNKVQKFVELLDELSIDEVNEILERETRIKKK